MNATGTQKRDPTGIGKQGKVWEWDEGEVN